jgi:hypothetical protein
MAEVIIAGRRVVLKEHLPARDHYALPRALSVGIGRLPFEEQVGPLSKVVESWEFEGDPGDLAAWGELDVMAEFMPLWDAIVRHTTARMAAMREKSKNLASPPT